MSIPKFTLFEHRLEEKYNNIIVGLPEMIKALKLSNSLEDGKLKKIKADVFDDLYQGFDLGDFDVKSSEISVQNQEFNFDKTVAGEVLNRDLHSTHGSDYITLYYAIYTVPYAGKIDAL
ncbi:MAG: hypothetical protein ACRYGB_12130, partial [Janthinobacterium lividum]